MSLEFWLCCLNYVLYLHILGLFPNIPIYLHSVKTTYIKKKEGTLHVKERKKNIWKWPHTPPPLPASSAIKLIHLKLTTTEEQVEVSPTYILSSGGGGGSRFLVTKNMAFCINSCFHEATLKKKKIKFSSYIRKFRMEQLQSHIE